MNGLQKKLNIEVKLRVCLQASARGEFMGHPTLHGILLLLSYDGIKKDLCFIIFVHAACISNSFNVAYKFQAKYKILIYWMEFICCLEKGNL